MTGDAAAWTLIALVIAVTFASRLLGPMMMARLGASPRLTRFLEGMSVSVIAALVASIAAQSGPRGAVAIGVAALVMLVSRSAVLAMITGMALAALWSAGVLPGPS